MSREFDSANTQALSVAISGVNVPFSVSMWIKPTTIGADQMLACLTASGTRIHYIILGGPVNPKLKVITSDTGSAESVADVVTGSWQHVVGVWAAVNNRACYLNNVKATNGLPVSPSAPTMITLGAQPAGTNVYDGLIAEVSVFTEALTDAQVDRLYNGCPPRLLGGQSGNNIQRHHYWDLAGGVLGDPVRGAVLADLASATVTNDDHPRVYK